MFGIKLEEIRGNNGGNEGKENNLQHDKTGIERAKEKQPWAVDDWIKVIFSDESIPETEMMLGLEEMKIFQVRRFLFYLPGVEDSSSFTVNINKDVVHESVSQLIRFIIQFIKQSSFKANPITSVYITAALSVLSVGKAFTGG